MTNLTPYEREISSRATRAIAWQSSPLVLRLLRGDIPALLQTISELRQLVEDSRVRDKELADLHAQITGMKRTIETAPHALDCSYREWLCSQINCGEFHTTACNCWKSRLVSNWADKPEGK